MLTTFHIGGGGARILQGHITITWWYVGIVQQQHVEHEVVLRGLGKCNLVYPGDTWRVNKSNTWQPGFNRNTFRSQITERDITHP